MTTSSSGPTSNLNYAFAAAMEATQAQLTVEWFNNPFVQAILTSLREGMIVTDRTGVIKAWNPAMEKLVGLAADQMLGQQLTPDLVGLRNEDGSELDPNDCPLMSCFQNGLATMGNYRVIGRSGREVKVEISCIPVFSRPESIEGGVLCLHDASIQTSLERQIKDLFEISMVDPLTKVFNRTEFGRVLEQCVRAKHSTDHFRCSLIVADIDFFKAINDNYNHHIGDQTLVHFAGLLKKFTRSHDLVARFGGEEFLILCGNCDLESAIQRAEEIRSALTTTAMPMLDGKCVTASFGVAELEAGETANEFFVRADQAMLEAKETGRNRVVVAGDRQAQSGPLVKATQKLPEESVSGIPWRKIKGQSLICEEFVTTTPIAILTEQLRGFILETSAEIHSVEADYASLNIAIKDPKQPKQQGNFRVDIEFRSSLKDGDSTRSGRHTTYIRILILEGPNKWFAKNDKNLAPTLLREIRRYLMISDDSARLKIDPAFTNSSREG